MKIRLTHVSLLLLFLLLFTFCDDSLVNPELPDDAAAKKRSKPTANAGVDRSIELPTNSILLDGSLSLKGGYTITEYQWIKLSGPEAFTIVDPSNKTTLVNNLIEGIYTFQLTVIDDHNFRDSDVMLVTVTKNTPQNAPTLTSFSPSSGNIGTTVTLAGTNFGASPGVSFNGTLATVITSSSTSITTTVPSGASTGTISVTSNGIPSTSGSTFNVLSLQTEDLYFHGNMDNVSITVNNSKLIFNGWTDLKNNAYINEFVINNIGGIPYAFQEIRKDPVDATKNVMYAQTVDDDPAVSGTSRAQMTLRFKSGVNLPVYHTSHRMYLNPDIAHMTNYSPAITWFTIFEIWNQHVAAWDGDVAGSARWGLSIQKASGTGQPLYWRIKSETMQPENVKFNKLWSYTNTSVPIPLGKWFTLDLYMKRGEGANGRMTVKITPDGGPTTVLFDIANTTSYPGHPEIQLSSWQPFKLYLDDVYLDWMRANNKKISAFYNDFKWYKN